MSTVEITRLEKVLIAGGIACTPPGVRTKCVPFSLGVFLWGKSWAGGEP